MEKRINALKAKLLMNNARLLNYLIIALFTIKIIIAGFFSSGYLSNLFYPFISYFTEHAANPWTHFMAANPSITFPYPPLMLYLLSPFVALSHLFTVHYLYFIQLIVKIPILLADIFIFYILNKFQPQAKLLLTLAYVCSPIIFFATYLQGHLDLIPTASLFSAIYLLIQKRFNYSAALLAAALLCKTTAIIALPFMLIYLYRSEGLHCTLLFLALVLSIYFLGSMPFIFNPSYLQAVLNNPQQAFIFNSAYTIGDLKLYPIIALMLCLVAHFMLYKKINKDLLLSYISLAFSLLLVFAYPVPSWFVWIMPFLSLFYVIPCNERFEIWALYGLFCVVYIVFFLYFYRYPLNDSLSNLMFMGRGILSGTYLNEGRNLTFTLLSTMLALQVYLNYRYSIRSNRIYKSRNRATLIGISGDSGAGKSVLLADIHQLLGSQNVTVLEGDGEHRWERGNENWAKFTHLDPRANLLHQQVTALDRLKNGLKVYRRDYDHHTGKFTEAKLVHTNDYVIIAGLHPFYLPKARKLIDIKIYIDTDEQLRKHWKIIRDREKRGYSKEQVLKSLEQRNPDREKFIIPQKNFANVCFRYFTNDEFSEGDEQANPPIKLGISFSANINLDDFYNLLNNHPTLNYEYNYSEDLHTQEVVFYGDITAQQLENIAVEFIENIDELVDGKPIWENGLRGLRQLMLLIVISHHLKEAL